MSAPWSTLPHQLRMAGIALLVAGVALAVRVRPQPLATA